MRYILLLLFSVSSVFANIDTLCPQFSINGTPSYTPIPNDIELCNQNYAVVYRCSTKTPMAVLEHVTTNVFSGKSIRKNNFHSDDRLMPSCRSTLKDYDQHYDRGHMSPAEDNTQTDSIMTDSFLLSNIVPQNINNNRGIWRKLETDIRKMASNGGDIYVVSGPVYEKGYVTIGKNVAVPTHLFKIITDKKTNKTTAYLIPNTDLPIEDLPKYITTVEDVEKSTGFTFHLP